MVSCGLAIAWYPLGSQLHGFLWTRNYMISFGPAIARFPLDSQLRGFLLTRLCIFQIPDFIFQIPDSGFQIADFRLQISDFRFRISDFEVQISDFGFEVSEFVCAGSRKGIQPILLIILLLSSPALHTEYATPASRNNVFPDFPLT